MSFNTTFHFYRHNLIALNTLLKDTQHTTDRARRQLRILHISSLVIRLFSLLGKNKEGHTTLGVWFWVAAVVLWALQGLVLAKVTLIL